MVKTRLKKWNYSKNVSVKSDEVESLMELIFDAESHGDVRKASTEVKLSTGRVVGLDRVAAHLRRKKVSPIVLQKASQLSLARYGALGHGHGQSPSPRSMVIDSPLVFRIPEAIFADIHASVQAHVAAATAASSSSSSSSSNTMASKKVVVMRPIEKKVFDLTFSARSLYVQGKMSECFALLRVVPDRIKDVFQSDPSLFPFSIFTFVVHLLTIPGAEQLRNTVKALVRYAAAAVSEAHPEWPPDHPFRRILFLLTQVEEESLLDVAVGGYKQQLISYERLTIPSEREMTIPTWLDLGESAGFDVLPCSYLEASLFESYQNKLAELGEHQEETIYLLFLLADLERQKVKARGISSARQKELLEMVLAACQDYPTDTPLVAELNCHYYLAQIYKTEGRQDLAEHHMRMCIDYVQRRGETALAVQAMTELQTWLQAWGDDAKVQTLKDNIDHEIVDLQEDSTSAE